MPAYFVSSVTEIEDNGLFRISFVKARKAQSWVNDCLGLDGCKTHHSYKIFMPCLSLHILYFILCIFDNRQSADMCAFMIFN